VHAQLSTREKGRVRASSAACHLERQCAVDPGIQDRVRSRSAARACAGDACPFCACLLHVAGEEAVSFLRLMRDFAPGYCSAAFATAVGVLFGLGAGLRALAALLFWCVGKRSAHEV
jgi:hypothetical protein